jgi:TolB protein
MHSFFRILVLLALAAAPAFAQGTRKIGDVTIVVDNQTIPVRITANSPELQQLASLAFSTHGRYDITGRRAAAYEFKFTNAGNQVRIDILKGSAAAVVASEVVTGTSPRNALMKAADVAVAKTNGLGLRGYFTGRLAFLSQRSGKAEVYTADLSELLSGRAQQITHDGALALFPRWTPDGSRIIYTSFFRSGAPDIFLLDPVSGRKDTFVSLRGSNMSARFSPNGQQVAMVLTGEGNPEIYVSNAQGRQISRKTRSDVVKSSPCWSPDGSQIMFAMDPGPQLYVMPAAGGQPRRVSGSYSYMAEPDWSRADRNKVACTVRVPGNGYQIAVIDLSTGKATVASKAAFDGIEPAWLADGRHLVYTARDRRTSVLSILDTETGRSTPITRADAAALQAAVWTP